MDVFLNKLFSPLAASNLDVSYEVFWDVENCILPSEPNACQALIEALKTKIKEELQSLYPGRTIMQNARWIVSVDPAKLHPGVGERLTQLNVIIDYVISKKEGECHLQLR
jgi:hypothetical protein